MSISQHMYNVTRTAGKGKGTQMGISTINFIIPSELIIPYGVYAAWVFHENKKYRSAVHFGPRPTLQETDPSLEAYILDGKIPVQTDQFKLQFVQLIRDETTFLFTSEAKMLARIQLDIKEISNCLQ